MMRNLGRIILIILICQACVLDPPKINCAKGHSELKEEIQAIFNSEQIQFNTIVLKEEIYFPTVVAFEIDLINPTTKTLDFKTLDSIKYIRFVNYEEIDELLKTEAEQLVTIVRNSCDLNDFTSIMINFTRKIDKYELEYSFNTHLELKNYITGHKKNIEY